MKNLNKQVGNYGEDIASNYLEKNNYIIECRNFRCKIGEIDIIARDCDYICFIEVKARYEKDFGLPMEAVNGRKQKRLYKIAEYYIQKNNIFNMNFRFDVVSLLFNNNDSKYEISVIKNAF